MMHCNNKRYLADELDRDLISASHDDYYAESWERRKQRIFQTTFAAYTAPTNEQ